MFRAENVCDVEESLISAAKNVTSFSLIQKFNSLQGEGNPIIDSSVTVESLINLSACFDKSLKSITNDGPDTIEKIRILALKLELLKEIIAEKNGNDTLYQTKSDLSSVLKSSLPNLCIYEDKLRTGEVTPFEAIEFKKGIGRDTVSVGNENDQENKIPIQAKLSESEVFKQPSKEEYQNLNDFRSELNGSNDSNKRDQGKKYWDCPKCTFHNEISMRRCDMCNCHRPVKLPIYDADSDGSFDCIIGRDKILSKKISSKRKSDLETKQQSRKKIKKISRLCEDGSVSTAQNSTDSNSEEEPDLSNIDHRGEFANNNSVLDDFHDVDYENRISDLKGKSTQTNKYRDNDDAMILEGGLKIPADIVKNLYQYQITGIRWMWQLHEKGAGGIVGDEMGLGKTTQVAAYLGALQGIGRLVTSIVVSPATLLHHWKRELNRWAPVVRVILLHQSGKTYRDAMHSSGIRSFIKSSLRKAPAVVIVTSYEGLRRMKSQLLAQKWDVAVLDEAQHIRNPDADITLVCKRLQTPARLALTGTPIQNSLVELWSLFDFVFPGRLGTLPVFIDEFATPIRLGGYSNASEAQVQIAFKSSIVLKDLIDPFLLRRQKKDVRMSVQLPKKTEQVLFCRISPHQRSLYMDVVSSPIVQSLLRGEKSKGKRLKAISILRKICNHADLLCHPHSPIGSVLRKLDQTDYRSDTESDFEDVPSSMAYGDPERSGKLMVLEKLLPLWKTDGHRVLLFSQTRKMLNIIEKWIKSKDWMYLRMDGCSPVGSRQGLVDRFNSDSSIFLMIATTRTGGVGTNLTGANRVVLYDPDWNPSTDAQARERAWRIGQKKPVTVYRLITAGTIEEKIYHRQIFKTAMTNRILVNPKQQRLFSRNDLHDLFLLGDDGSIDGYNETVDAFNGEGRVKIRHCKDGRAEIIDGLIREVEVTVKNGCTDKKKTASNSTEKNSQDTNVLRALFNGAPLSSVFIHDLAEGKSYLGAQVTARLERQAEIIAQNALERLRKNRQAVLADTSTRTKAKDKLSLTWTGRSGESGKRFGSAHSASESLLAAISENTERYEGHSLGRGQEEMLLIRLKDFFSGNDEEPIKTARILKEFRDVPDDQAALFKKLLGSVASCKRGRWTWKNDSGI